MSVSSGLLDKSSPIPLYYQLFLRLRAEIHSGAARPGELLGTEREIQERFSVSRATVRKALDELERTGKLVRVTGRGTFVGEPAPAIHTPHLLSFTEELHRRGVVPDGRVLAFGPISPPDDVAEALGSIADESVLHIRRLRTGDGIPIVLVDHYLAPNLLLDRASLQQSLYATLEGVLGVRLLEAFHSVRAGLATEEEAAMLNITRRDAVLRFTRTTLGPKGTPLVFERGTGRADLYDYSVHLHREMHA
jgi:GntR family transcriptional regulator